MDLISSIDVEAEATEDPSVPEEVIEADVTALHGETPPAAVALLPPPAVALDSWKDSVVQWLGRDAVEEAGPTGTAVIMRSLSKMPEAEPEDSFVWSAIGGPGEINEVAAAIMDYRRVDSWALEVIDAMGANGCFRRWIRGSRQPDKTPLHVLVREEERRVEAIERLGARVARLEGAMEAVFGEGPFTVAQGLAALCASRGLISSMPRFHGGFSLSRTPEEAELDALDLARRRAVAAAGEVQKACRVDPLVYSRGVLAGVRRSLDDRRAGDFTFAVESIGGEIHGREGLVDAGRTFATFFAACDAFSEAASSLGYSPSDEPALLSHVLARRLLASGARAAGVRWEDVSSGLRVRCDLDAEAALAAIQGLGDEGLAGQLSAVTRQLDHPLAAVLEAGRRVCIERGYRAAAGRRVLAARGAATVGEIRRVMDFEPGMEDCWKRLRSRGVTSRADVDPLERHVMWLVAAYALPVPDEAVTRLVETRGGVLPLRRSA